MMEAHKHPRENERLNSLYACQILDTEREAEFDDIVKLAAAICGTAASTITFVDSNRQWFKAATGMPSAVAPLELAICAHTLLSENVVEIPDTRMDPRTMDNPLCAVEGGCRFYAGAPLMGSNGLPLGTLCVLDFVPKQLNAVQRYTLQVLAHHVVKLLELRNERRNAELLRHEVDHRVKNSLSNLASMVRLEKRKTDDAKAGDILNLVSRHIEIAATIHQALYRTSTEGSISIKELLDHVCALIQESLPQHISMQASFDEAIISDMAASKVAIIVNEIATNATKHAFPNDREGLIKIVGQNHKNGQYILTASDNGIGNNGAGELSSSGIGMRIMQASASQISGVLSLREKPSGMIWELAFPLTPQP